MAGILLEFLQNNKCTIGIYTIYYNLINYRNKLGALKLINLMLQ